MKTLVSISVGVVCSLLLGYVLFLDISYFWFAWNVGHLVEVLQFDSLVPFVAQLDFDRSSSLISVLGLSLSSMFSWLHCSWFTENVEIEKFLD